jgi:hypothetical protein
VRTLYELLYVSGGQVMRAPKLVSIAVERSQQEYIAVDSQGRLWRGRATGSQRGEYIKWEQVEQEFPRETK